MFEDPNAAEKVDDLRFVWQNGALFCISLFKVTSTLSWWKHQKAPFNQKHAFVYH